MKNKTVKKFLATAMVGTMALGLVACGDKTKVDTNDKTETEVGDEVEVDDAETSDGEVSLSHVEQILVDAFDLNPLDFPIMTWALDVENADIVKSYAGLNNGDKLASLAVSEPALGGRAYSAIVAEVKDVSEVETVAAEMKNGVNPSKWGDDIVADSVVVKTEGKYICLVMSSSQDGPSADELTSLMVKIITGEVVAPEREDVEGDVDASLQEALDAEAEEIGENATIDVEETPAE